MAKRQRNSEEMPPRPLATGDRVKLPSGGQPMTVTQVDGAGRACLAWFDHAGLLHTATLPVEALVPDALPEA